MIIWLSGFCIHDTVQWLRLSAAKQWCGERKRCCCSVGACVKEKYHAAQPLERKYQYCWLWGDFRSIKMLLLLLFFIWFSGFGSDAKLFISRHNIHYPHVIWSFISGLFDQDYTLISAKTSCLASPKQLWPVRRIAADHCGPRWVPRSAELCHVKHLNFAVQL